MYLENRELFSQIINNNNYKTGAEIGVRHGWFSELLIKTTEIQKWYAIDHWNKNEEQGSGIEEERNTRSLLSPYQECEIIKQSSLDASKQIDDKSLDFVYIDANHNYDYVKQDITVWWQKLSNGGCLAGHDYVTWCDGVIKAVDEFIKETGLELHLTGIGSSYGTDGGDCNANSWFIFKKE